MRLLQSLVRAGVGVVLVVSVTATAMAQVSGGSPTGRDAGVQPRSSEGKTAQGPSGDTGHDEDDGSAASRGSAGPGAGGGHEGHGTPDQVEEDKSLKPGTIAVELRDEADRPLPSLPFTLAILRNSVAKGESREHRGAMSDGEGRATFADLPIGSGIAYRITATRDRGSFGSMPFVLNGEAGVRVLLHVYPATDAVVSMDDMASGGTSSREGKALLLGQGYFFAEVKDDRIQVEQVFRYLNAGKVAWVPQDLVLPLPEGFTALGNAGQSMSTVGIDPVDKRGARLRGTFGPGEHEVAYRWQLPYNGESTVALNVPMPPNLVNIRVMSPASSDMRLSVEGFPPAETRSDGQGQRLLVTERQLRRGEGSLREIRFSLRDIPGPGPERFVATAIAGAIVAFGLWASLSAAFAGKTKSAKKDGRAKDQQGALQGLLLSDMEELERAFRRGDVGPKTYERARRALVDALARTLELRQA